MSAYEEHHRRALAREMTAAAGFPLRDRYGFAARDDDVDWILFQLVEEPDDKTAAESIGLANVTGEIEIAQGYDEPTGEAYELGIVRALRPLLEQQWQAAGRALS